MTHRDGTEEPGGADEIAAARDALGGRHDPLDGRHDAQGDLSGTGALRLQDAMERTGKVQDHLANALKEPDDPQDRVADNLK